MSLCLLFDLGRHKATEPYFIHNKLCVCDVYVYLCTSTCVALVVYVQWICVLPVCMCVSVVCVLGGAS